MTVETPTKLELLERGDHFRFARVVEADGKTFAGGPCGAVNVVVSASEDPEDGRMIEYTHAVDAVSDPDKLYARGVFRARASTPVWLHR